MSDAASDAGKAGEAARDVPKAAPPVRPTPQVEDPKLNNIVDNLFKGVDNPERVGDGTTMDAIRHERATGEDVHGRTHQQKGRDEMRASKNWLRRNPDVRQSDRDVAEQLLKELEEAYK